MGAKKLPLTHLSYTDKLLDKRWQEKRLAIILRDNNKCRHCGASHKSLNVHHIKYTGEPWECPDAFLITLCFGCHEKAEELKVDMYYFYKIIMEKNLSKENLLPLLWNLDDVNIDNKQQFFDALGWLITQPEEMELIINKHHSINFLK